MKRNWKEEIPSEFWDEGTTPDGDTVGDLIEALQKLPPDLRTYHFELLVYSMNSHNPILDIQEQ